MNKKGTVLTSEVPSAVGGTLAIVTVFVASGQEVPPCMDNSTGEFAPCQIMLAARYSNVDLPSTKSVTNCLARRRANQLSLTGFQHEKSMHCAIIINEISKKILGWSLDAPWHSYDNHMTDIPPGARMRPSWTWLQTFERHILWLEACLHSLEHTPLRPGEAESGRNLEETWKKRCTKGFSTIFYHILPWYSIIFLLIEIYWHVFKLYSRRNTVKP